MIKKIGLDVIKKVLAKKGYSVIPRESYPSSFSQEFVEAHKIAKPFTACGMFKIYGVYEALKYVIKNNIEGDIVETGVWKGGVPMFMSYLFKKWEIKRPIYLYDTFQGKPKPTDEDRDWRGRPSIIEYNRRKDNPDGWGKVCLEEVKNNAYSVGYDRQYLKFIVGKVEDTLTEIVPDKIAVLRLDTGFYSSIKFTLEQLYPRLVNGGILIIDDYSQLEGCRKAVDDYFKDKDIFLSLTFGGMCGVKYQKN